MRLLDVLKFASRCFTLSLLPVSAAALENGFRNPPHSAKPHTWYHMMNGNISKAGVTRDFEEIAKAGLGGVQMFDIGSDAPPGPLKFNTPEWFDLMRHAHNEARRLRLEVCVRDCSGWSNSGGTWVRPEDGMKRVVHGTTAVKGPARFNGILRRTKSDNGFYRDIAVLAFPTPRKGWEVLDLRRKSGLVRERFKETEFAFRNMPADRIVKFESVRDLTGKMSADGRLAWDVPAGDWTILRIGFVCNGRRNHPASQGAQGLEIDKLSAESLDRHFDAYLTRLFKAIGLQDSSDRTSGVNAVLVDSYEVSGQNWTQGLESVFEKRIGYSMRPYLPVLAGYHVRSVWDTERFLEDFRRVLADLFAENYVGRMVERCHALGLSVVVEPYGNGTFDDLQIGALADIPMGEFWNRSCLGEHGFGGPGNSRLAAYIAHVWGKRIVEAESFTSSPPLGGRWTATPFAIKNQNDRAFAEGVNRIVYHRYAHQPWPDDRYLPGMTMGRHGMHLDRTQTWWRHAPAWFTYQSRCQWMLQEGNCVADALYWSGERTPNPGYGCAGPLYPEGDLRGAPADGILRGANSMPRGYNWDVCDTKAMELLRVRDGKVVAPGGTEYAMLVLPTGDVMSERMLRRVGELAVEGARIVAPARPARSPGLRWRITNFRAYPELRAAMWAKGVWECSPADALKRLGIDPDFSCDAPDAVWIHRRGDSADWYFVARDNADPVSFEASFRIAGKVPEIWNAETGEVADAKSWRVENGRTVVRLDFPPSGSAFVVFRRNQGPADAAPTAGRDALEPQPAGEMPAIPVAGPWQVSFPVDWYSGGTNVKSFTWAALGDWTADCDPDVKYFSGTATYRTSCRLPCVSPGSRAILSLGEVKNFAEVTVNGKTFPVMWRPPFQVDVTDALASSGKVCPDESAPCRIDLEIKVTNLWPNRLIGDDVQFADDCVWRVPPRRGEKRKLALAEIPEWVKRGEPSPTGRHTFTTYRHWTKADAPLPAGILGPVCVKFRR